MFKALLSILLVALLSFTVITWSLLKMADPVYLNAKLKENNLYGRLADNLDLLIPDEIVDQTQTSKSEIASIIIKSIDSNEFYSITNTVSTGYLNYITGKTNSLDLEYDLKPIKDSMSQNSVNLAISRYYDLSECTAEAKKTWSAEGGFPPCKLSSSSTTSPDVEQMIRSEFNKSNVLDPIPDKIDVNTISPDLAKAQAKTARTIKIFKIIWIITALIALLMIVIYRRRSFIPLAVVFLLVGLINTVSSYLLWDWLANIINQSLKGASNNNLLPLLFDVVNSILQSMKTNLGNISIVCLIIGAVFLVFGLIFKPKVGALPQTQPSQPAKS